MVLGRIFDSHLYDAIELGVDDYKSMKSFANAATGAQLGSKVRSCLHLPVNDFSSGKFAFGYNISSMFLASTFSNVLILPLLPQPCVIFVGEKFESVPEMKQLKSVLLDYFRGEQVDAINLAGLDRVIMAVAAAGDKLLLRQYTIKLKKSGTRVPRVALREMGPSLDLAIRRLRAPPSELEKEACRQPKLGKKTVRGFLVGGACLHVFGRGMSPTTGGFHL